MKSWLKKGLRRILGWYVEPLYSRTAMLETRAREAEDRFEGIAEREEWTRGRFEEVTEKEERLRGYTEEQRAQMDRLEQREEQLNGRFEEHRAQLDRLEQKSKQTEDAIMQLALQNRSASEADNVARTYAQSGEDAIAAYVLRFLQKSIREVTYLDLGANHAKELSNTYYFYINGARGVLVEANPELIDELMRVRPADVVLNVAVGEKDGETIDFYSLNGDGLSTISLESANAACERNPDLYIKAKYEVETLTVNTILEKYFTEPPTILSIDLEGIEETVIQSLDFDRFSPWIIILENIPYTPLLAIENREFKCADFLQSKGYTEYAFTGINSIFVLKKAVHAFNERRLKELRGDRV